MFVFSLALGAQTVTKDSMASNRPATRWVTSFQTGMAETFQLTLGGTFGAGPAWQNRLTTGLTNVFRSGDTFYIYGWDTFDAPSHSNDYQGGAGYKAPVWRKGAHGLALGTGVQYWRFPSVKTGTNDWLIPGNLILNTKVRAVPIVVTSDSWTLLKSPLPTGSLLHTQGWMEHRLFKRDWVNITFRHGPAYTYSWNFYGTNGSRVFRYQTMMVMSFKDFTFDGGYRKQWGLQPGIVDNTYWQFSLTKTFTK
ncbi:MAG: hypothetical protein HY821_21305 [Acidobacteria bacterium]|nr:hypothetical protein [Acidobacteriota bacterium]